MHSPFEVFFNRVRGKRYSTKGFFDSKGEFLQKGALLQMVFSVLPPERVAAIYLIGSLVALRGKDYVYFQPRDVDVFVQVNCDREELYKLREKFFGTNLTLLIGGREYPVHWLVYDCDPFEVYERYDELELCFEKYRLYP
jgi:predicted nucleotidyltransferase